ncbi:unnamed protein product, partial [Candidula unifasciata]
ASTKLLASYPKQLQEQILDYLFLPNFGASLQILKVEIGGDVQSTDGSEASHMHTAWEENYSRGYEWWLMVEAKKRNPDIKLYALAWGFPGWISPDKSNPYKNSSVLADYIVKWIAGARTYYSLEIDFIGIWNERDYNIGYIKTLRDVLDQRGFSNVLIIASDNGWGIASDVLKDPELASDVYAIGAHYPDTYSSTAAQKTGHLLWASEDYSTYNDEVGAGCWARTLNQNYVNGLMTATISWSLIASYYEGLPFYRDGLMTAAEPWSGHYVVNSPIWVSAHTTQFTSFGWKYLQHGSGVGKLPQGGSYVGLVNPTVGDLTIIIETMTHAHSHCVYSRIPAYTVLPQNITIVLGGRFASVSKLYVWYSQLSFNSTLDSMFVNKGAVEVVNGSVQLSLGLDEMYTLTTVSTGLKGSYPPPPESRPFPLPYSDDFEGYSLHQEPSNLAQQLGSFEVLQSGHNQFLRQMALSTPITWCGEDKMDKTLNIIGNSTWQDILIEVDFEFPVVNATTGVFVAARVNQAQCSKDAASGIYLFVTPEYNFILASNIARTAVITTGTLPHGGGWHRLSLFVQNQTAYLAYDEQPLVIVAGIPKTPLSGFVGIGTDNYGLADFDNLHIAGNEDGIKQMKKYFNQPLPRPLYFRPEHQ